MFRRRPWVKRLPKLCVRPAAQPPKRVRQTQRNQTVRTYLLGQPVLARDLHGTSQKKKKQNTQIMAALGLNTPPSVFPPSLTCVSVQLVIIFAITSWLTSATENSGKRRNSSLREQIRHHDSIVGRAERSATISTGKSALFSGKQNVALCFSHHITGKFYTAVLTGERDERAVVPV